MSPVIILISSERGESEWCMRKNHGILDGEFKMEGWHQGSSEWKIRSELMREWFLVSRGVCKICKNCIMRWFIYLFL